MVSNDSTEDSGGKKFVELAGVVSDHLTSIQDAFREYQAVDDSVRTGSVSAQLEGLLARVRGIEAEALHTKELLKDERHRSHHDSLTGLYNRAAYNERAFLELRRYKRYHRPLSIAVCDIDFFKSVNDRFGHKVGDRVLRVIARVIAIRLRKTDFIARLGGEEFVILMPETKSSDALRVLDSTRKMLKKIPLKAKGVSFNITTSFGITELVADDSIDSAFERADKALYSVKTSGRDGCQLQIKRVLSDAGLSEAPLNGIPNLR